ncbi:MAG: HXXEE domain-containing protein [Candidatus Ornithomonoglobus sp.]
MNLFVEWLIKIWLYVISGVTGAMICYLIVKKKTISTQKRLICFFIIALTLHVLEEWVWPAGLHYIHNLSKGSTFPNDYPMNQFADMITNSVAVLIALGVLWKLSENAVAGFTITLFGFSEAVAHIRLGIIGYQQFHSAGLNFPYSPGLATAIFGFLIISILLTADLVKRKQLNLKTILGAIASLIIVIVILVVIPENGLKDMDTPYVFPNAGFYEQFLN